MKPLHLLFAFVVGLLAAAPVLAEEPCGGPSGLDVGEVLRSFVLPYVGAALGVLALTEGVRRFWPSFRTTPKGLLSARQQLVLEGLAAAAALASGFHLPPVAAGLYGQVLTGAVVMGLVIANFHAGKRVFRLAASKP